MSETHQQAAKASHVTHDGDGDDQYKVTSRIEIISILRALAADRVLVTVFYEGLEHFVLTRILAINPDFEEVVFDGVSNPAARMALRSAVGVKVHAFHHQIKIIFDADHAELTLHDDLPAFRMRLPSAVIRLQRRSDYRAKAPVLSAATLSIMRESDVEPLRTRILDISCGGLSFAYAVEKAEFSPGEILTDCVLDMTQIAKLEVSLEIRHFAEYKDGLGRPMRRYGCKFIRLSGASSTLVQRYINQVEIDRRKSIAHL
jgi:flagellar brake protein